MAALREVRKGVQVAREEVATLRGEVGDSVRVLAEFMGDRGILGELCDVVGKWEAEEREGRVRPALEGNLRDPWPSSQTPRGRASQSQGCRMGGHLRLSMLLNPKGVRVLQVLRHPTL